MLRILREAVVLLMPLLSMQMESCGPSMPPEGTWTVKYPGDIPFEVESVVVSGSKLTISIVDSDGVESVGTYIIEPE